METYIVRVNGIEYEVEVEKKSGSQAAPKAAAVPQTAAPQTAPAQAPAASQDQTGEPVIAGTTGKIWKVVAKEGDAVKRGDTVVILEAMKMEIPVVAPADGTLGAITVTEGQAIESGHVISYVK